jgi:hypothetical protein
MNWAIPLLPLQTLHCLLWPAVQQTDRSPKNNVHPPYWMYQLYHSIKTHVTALRLRHGVVSYIPSTKQNTTWLSTAHAQSELTLKEHRQINCYLYDLTDFNSRTGLSVRSLAPAFWVYVLYPSETHRIPNTTCSLPLTPPPPPRQTMYVQRKTEAHSRITVAVKKQ